MAAGKFEDMFFGLIEGTDGKFQIRSCGLLDVAAEDVSDYFAVGKADDPFDGLFELVPVSDVETAWIESIANQE